MSGQFIVRTERPHVCRPPMEKYTITLPAAWSADKKPHPTEMEREPAVGTVWRCDCGILWEVMRNPYINVLKEGDWKRADWITRLKYRKRK